MISQRTARSQPSWWPFVVSAGGLLLVFVASGTPIPLFNTYRSTTSITDADLALTTFVYLGTTALTLLMLGRLSDHLGRRTVSVAAVLIGAAGCLVLTQVDTPWVLAVGRVLQGMACGLGSTALGAFVVDSAPARPSWLAALITSSAPPFAIPVGALFSGGLMKFAQATPTLGYLVVAGLLVIVAILLLSCRDTVTPKPGALRSVRPHVRIPPGTGRVIFAAGAAYFATWSMGGFFQAFSASLTADYLGSQDTFVIALVFSSVVILSPIGASLTGRLSPATAVRCGLIAFMIAAIGFISALQFGSIAWFLAASLVAGVAQGAANTGSMRSVLNSAPTLDRAGLLSTVYLICYSSGAIPSLVAGQLAPVLPVNVIAIGYGALIVVATTVCVLTIRNSPPADQR